MNCDSFGSKAVWVGSFWEKGCDLQTDFVCCDRPTWFNYYCVRYITELTEKGQCKKYTETGWIARVEHIIRGMLRY